MKNHIIHDSQPVILVGGAELGSSDFTLVTRLGTQIVAADGGAVSVLEAGHMPNAVIGDFDSITSTAIAGIPADRLHKISEQETTDFEKCLSRIHSPLILGIGFSGRRLDHELATLTALAKYPDQRCLLIGTDMVTFLAPPRMELRTAPGDLVSFYPLGRVGGTASGLEYPIEGIEFSPSGNIGTSNRSTGTINAEFSAPKMLVMLDRSNFIAAYEMLMENQFCW